MTTSSPSATELLRLPALRELLRSPGPCITVLSPAYRPGEPTGSPRAFLAASIREARQKLSAFLPNGALTALLRPLEETAEDPELAAGSHWGRAIFRSPAEFVQFRLIQPVRALSTVAGSFAIRPLMEEWSRSEAFYLLFLSKNKVAVFRCHDGSAEPVKLPSGVPDTLEDALQLEPPDHDLENRSPAGRSTGAMGGVRFGTGSGRETKHAHLADFYKLVDRALTELAGEPAAPLILAGAEEDAAIFRLISGYPDLIGESIFGSVGAAEPPQELLEESALHLAQGGDGTPGSRVDLRSGARRRRKIPHRSARSAARRL